MKEFYKYGIDLGTTNSCIAAREGEETKIFPNVEMMNVTPSAIYITKKGRMFVGRRAFDKGATEPENTKIEFKRQMGYKQELKFEDSGIVMTPIELSSEILKALCDNVKTLKGEEVKNAIITVPAAFGTLQCEATKKAAEISGIVNSELLQEPIAAAVAYGIKPDSKDNYYMVFDMGGGTLDIAIVSTHHNRLTILNHAGDNHLGGKNIDTAIIKDIILPSLRRNYNLPDDMESDAEFSKLLKKLKRPAEEAKIKLSTLNSDVIEIYDVGEDLDGEEISLSINVTRKELDNLIAPIIDKSVQLSEEAISGAGINSNLINKILLVGGTTLMPSIRQQISDHFKIELDCSIDPMTVVAQGAAIYASMCEIEDEIEIENIDIDSMDIAVEIECEQITSDIDVFVAGRFTGINSKKIADFTIESIDGTWTSGWIKINSDNPTFVIDINLRKNSVNTFTIKARSAKGLLEIKNSLFNIRHDENHMQLSNPPIPHSVSVEIIDDNKRLLKPLIVKNATLPAEAMYTFFTNKILRPNTDDALIIKLWEGEDYENPNNNMWLKNVYIRAEDIKRPVPKDCEVEVYLKLNKSRLLSCEVAIPHINLFISGETVYNHEPIDLAEMISQDIEHLYTELDVLDSTERIDSSEEYIDNLNNMRRELEDIDIEAYEKKKAHEVEYYDIQDKIKEFYRKLGEIEKTSKKYTEESKNEDIINRAIIDIKKHGNEDLNKRLEVYVRDYEEAVNLNDKKGEEIYINKIDGLYSDLLYSQPDYWTSWYTYLSSPSTLFVNANEAEYWISQGENAIDNQNLEQLRKCVINLYNLRSQTTEEVGHERMLPSGLRDRIL